MEYRISERTMQDIADAIKSKCYIKTSEKKTIDELLAMLSDIAPMRDMQMMKEGFSNGALGRQFARCAESYVFARCVLEKPFNYNNEAIFDYFNPSKKSTADKDGDDQDDEIMDEDYDPSTNRPNYDPDKVEGYRIYGYATEPPVKPKNIGFLGDCSTLIGLALRAIDYWNSPYHKFESARAWTPNTALRDMYGRNGFAQLDQQKKGSYVDLKIQNKSTIRYAADLAEFFYRQGYTVFDRRTDGVFSEEDFALIQPGDLIFWDTKQYKTRFLGISHVAMAANRPRKCVEFTHGTVDSLPHGVYYRSLVTGESNESGHKMDNVLLIIRPNYFSSINDIEDNLIGYPWTFSQFGWSINGKTYEGVGLELLNMHDILLHGISTGASNTTLVGSAVNEEDCFFLPTGTYKISGMENSPYDGNGLSLMVYDGSTNTKIAESYKDHDGTFEVLGGMRVYIRLHVGSSKQFDVEGIKITPTLTKIDSTEKNE